MKFSHTITVWIETDSDDQNAIANAVMNHVTDKVLAAETNDDPEYHGKHNGIRLIGAYTVGLKEGHR